MDPSFDLESFIEEIRKHEGIYNKEAFKDQESRALSWKIVADLSGKSEIFCQKKWKNLRDTYMREKKKSFEAKANADESQVKRKWVYFEQIDAFLAPHIKTHSFDNTYSRDADSGLHTDFKMGEGNSSLMDDYSVEAAMAAGNITVPRSVKPASLPRLWKRKNNLRPVKLFRAGDRPLREHDLSLPHPESSHPLLTDEEGLFGQSVASALRRLPPYKRALAKVKISQVLFDVEFQQVQNMNTASDATYQVIQPDVFQEQYPEVLQDNVTAVTQSSDPTGSSG